MIEIDVRGKRCYFRRLRTLRRYRVCMFSSILQSADIPSVCVCMFLPSFSVRSYVVFICVCVSALPSVRWYALCKCMCFRLTLTPVMCPLHVCTCFCPRPQCHDVPSASVCVFPALILKVPWTLWVPSLSSLAFLGSLVSLHSMSPLGFLRFHEFFGFLGFDEFLGFHELFGLL